MIFSSNLSAPGKGAKGGAAPAAKGAGKSVAAPPAAPPKVEIPPVETAGTDDLFSPLKEGQRREEQVELLRDRKTLELESSLWNERKRRDNEITDRYFHFINRYMN